MGSSGHITQTEQQNQHKSQSLDIAGPEVVANLMPEVSSTLTGGPSVEAQAAMLNRLPTAQGQAAAVRIGKVQGNRHFQRVMTALKTPKVQTKLTVSEPDDAYEQEADQVAEQVMTMANPPGAPSPPDDADTNNGEAPRGDNRLGALSRVQRSDDGISGNKVGSVIESRIQSIRRSSGQPLPQSERRFFESRMGVDLSQVTVHTDNQAAETTEDLNAQAYTVGSDVVFNKGNYKPGTTDGRRLLAHELTHVVQQGGAGVVSRQEKDRDEQDPPAPATTLDAAATEPPEVTAASETTAAVADTPLSDSQQETESALTAPEESAEAGVQPVQIQVEEESTADSRLQQAQQHSDTSEPEPGILPNAQAEASQDTREAEAQAESDQSAEDAQAAQAGIAEDAALASEGKAAEISPAAQEMGFQQPAAPLSEDQAQAEAESLLNVAPDVEASVAQQAESERLAQETSASMAALDGAAVIMPEDVWEKLNLAEAEGETSDHAFDAETAASQEQSAASDLLIQPTPDPGQGVAGLDFDDNGVPQFTPEPIVVPEITIDTAAITNAKSNATIIASTVFTAKHTALDKAVATSRKAIGGTVRSTLATLDKQLETNSEKIASATKTAKENITEKHRSASQALQDLEEAIPDRARALVKTNAVDLVDKIVQEYAGKCEQDALNAVAGYAAEQRATPDDTRAVLLGGPGEEKGYHAKKAAEAERVAKEVGATYAAEYRNQGAETIAVFNGEVLSGLIDTMKDEVSGMRQMLDTGLENALGEVDTVKDQLEGQAKALHAKSESALQAAYAAVMADLASYHTEYTAILTTAQAEFIPTLETAVSQAIAQVNASASQAQSALASVVGAATGPGKVLKPGAQALVDQTVAEIQASLAQQVNQAATQITAMGSNIATTLAGVDVKDGATAYSDSFAETAANMSKSAIEGLGTIVTNMQTYGDKMTTESATLFDSYAKTANETVTRIEETAGPNLAGFVNKEFAPGLEKTHNEMQAQAAEEGRKAGEAVQPAWKGWLKIIVSVVIAIAVAIAIAIIVVGTGGVAGLVLGALAGAAIGAGGGLLKCLAFNAIDGKPAFENVGRYVIEGAITGAIQGATAGLLAAPTGAAAVGLSGSRAAVSQFVGHAGKKLAVETLGGAIKDMAGDIYTQYATTGTVNWGAVGVKGLESAVLNVATFGVFKGAGAAGRALSSTGRAAKTAAVKQTTSTAGNAAIKSVDDGASAGSKNATTSFKGTDFTKQNGLYVPSGSQGAASTTQLGGTNFVKQNGLYVPSGSSSVANTAQFGGANFVKQNGLYVPSGSSGVASTTQLGGANFVKQNGLYVPSGSSSVANTAQFGGTNFIKQNGLYVPSTSNVTPATQAAAPGAWQQGWKNVSSSSTIRENFGKEMRKGWGWDDLSQGKINKIQSNTFKGGAKAGYYDNFFKTNGQGATPAHQAQHQALLNQGIPPQTINEYLKTQTTPSTGVDLTPWSTSKEMGAGDKKQAEANRRQEGYREKIGPLPGYNGTPYPGMSSVPDDYKWQTTTPSAPQVDFEPWGTPGGQSPSINQPAIPSFDINNTTPMPDLNWDVII